MPIGFHRPVSIERVKEGYKEGIKQTVSNLQTIIDLFKEKLADLGETSEGRAARSFGDLDIHPEIERASGDLFRDGHYSSAVERACVVLDSMVKIRSGKDDLSGRSLMNHVFSPKNPLLRFNELSNETDRSEQEGMMYLYTGAMLAIRNPRAHQIIEDDPELALEYISFLNLLVKSLDRAK